VSTRGKAYTKRLANLGLLPAPGGVVVKDIVNYHRHRIPLPRVGEELAVDLRWDAPFPAHREESILQIGLATAQILDVKDLEPLNLALVIDRSSSMAADDKMGRLKQALALFVRRLRPTDRLAIVAYSSAAEVCLASQPVGDGRRALAVIQGLQPDGYTNLHSGLMLGYGEVNRHCEERANHRVILLTDGLANRGITEPAEIAAESKRFNSQGIDLSTIGFGRDINHDLLDQLARSGRGLFHFVADVQDIEKVFVAEAQSLMGIIGRNARVEIEPGPGLEIVRIYGYHPRQTEAGVVIEHENFNQGMTAVLIVQVRHRAAARSEVEGSSRRLPVRVQVSYDSARTGRRVEHRASTGFLQPRRARGAVDHVVRKNFSIALMAEAMHRMAEDVAAKRFADADRALSRAEQFVRCNHPGTDDPDLLENRRLLQKYRTILARHIERFREWTPDD
jgi:hypothetical protein